MGFVVVVVGLVVIQFDGALGDEGPFDGGTFVDDLFKGRHTKNL